MTTKLDKIDRLILDALQRDADISGKKLAELCHVSEATCSRRLSALAKQGYIEKHSVVLNRKKLGFHLSVFVLVILKDELSVQKKRFIERLQKVPQILNISFISGEYDYLLHFVASDMHEYNDFADAYLGEENHVKKYTSLFEMKSFKSGAPLPLVTSTSAL